MCSAVGLVSVGFVTMFALLRASKRTAVTIVAPAAIVFATWFVVRGHSGGRLHLTGDALIRTPQFVWVGLSATTGDWLGVPNSGGLLLIALVLCTLLVRDVAPALRDLAWAGQAAAVAQMALSALANYFLGISAANVGRYEYVAFVFLVPSGVIGAYGIGRAVHNGVRGRQATAAAVLASVLLIAAAVNGLAEERERMVSTRAFSGIYRSWILGTRDAQAAGETVLTAHPSDGFNQPMDMSLVTDLAAMGALPPTREASDRLAAESQFFVEVGAVDPHRFTPTHVTYHGLERRGRGRGALDGCQVLVPDGTGAPTVDVSTGNGTEVGIVSNASVVTTQVYRAYIGSGTRTWPVLPGAIYISTSAHDAILRITLNATEKFSLCHQ
jgi:hypothetical protein